MIDSAWVDACDVDKVEDMIRNKSRAGSKRPVEERNEIGNERYGDAEDCE